MSNRYVALLRGVNVGGNHRVPKQDFKRLLEEAGCLDVTIYLNSGNAVFTYDGEVSNEQIQHPLESFFNFSIPTLVLGAEKIQKIAALIPPEWSNDTPQSDKSGQKSDILYLFDEINTPDIIDKMGYRPEIETMTYTDGAVLANISRKNQSKGSLQKLIGTNLYTQMTIRNINTARKLAELL